MTQGNQRLAEALTDEAEGVRILAALADHGVLLGVHADGSILFAEGDGEAILPAFTSVETFGRVGVEGSVRQAEAATLLAIARDNGVGQLFVDPGGPQSAAIPFGHLADYLAQHGAGMQDDITIQLRVSEHPWVERVRATVAHHVGAFPQVRTVWITDVRMPDGVEGLMLHVAAGDADSVGGLLPTVLADLPADQGGPLIFARAVNSGQEQELTAMGATAVAG